MTKHVNKHYQALQFAGYSLEPRSGSGGWNSLYATMNGERQSGFKYRSNNQSHTEADFRHAQAGSHKDQAMQDLCEDLNLEVKKYTTQSTPVDMAKNCEVVVHEDKGVELQFGDIGVAYKIDAGEGLENRTIQREAMCEDSVEKVDRVGKQLFIPDNISLDSHLDSDSALTSMCRRDAELIEDMHQDAQAEKQNESTNEKEEGLTV